MFAPRVSYYGFLLILIAFFNDGCSMARENTLEPRPGDSNNHSPEQETSSAIRSGFGNPSNARHDEENVDNYLVEGNGSVFSFNNDKGTLNWVAWKTTRADLGDRVERPDFRADPKLPPAFKHIQYYDYSGSGFDRGHMVPAADRFADPIRMNETFLMTNIVPQTPSLNQFPWQQLESYARSQAWRGSDVYQIAGVYGDAGELKGKVTVPTNCWKIVIIVPKGRSIEALDRQMRVIAVDMPNRDGLERSTWQMFATTIRDIENKTGYDFLNYLPQDFQDGIENRMEILSRNR